MKYKLALREECLEMDYTVEKLQEKHTAGEIIIGYDYQFFYFVYLVLQLKPGQSIGFEIKDDIHIKRQNGTELLQLKHTVAIQASGEKSNLTELDRDFWKTLGFWAECINCAADKNEFLNTHTFRLVTNKSNNNNNDFLQKLTLFKSFDLTYDSLREHIKDLSDKTENDTIKDSIKNIFRLTKKQQSLFFQQLEIVTNKSKVIQDIKNIILEKIMLKERVEEVYETLLANLQTNKYLDIEQRKNFEISFDDFTSKYGKCFGAGFNKDILQVREFKCTLPEKIEEQNFIKQLLDIQEITTDETEKMMMFTTFMLNAFNNLKYWEDQYIILNSERRQFDRNAILFWENTFNKHYREIKRLKDKEDIDKLEEKIIVAAQNCLDEIRCQSLSIRNNDLGGEFSNGYFYMLSDELRIGWHFDWKNKYKNHE